MAKILTNNEAELLLKADHHANSNWPEKTNEWHAAKRGFIEGYKISEHETPESEYKRDVIDVLCYDKNFTPLYHGDKVLVNYTYGDGTYNHEGVWEVRSDLIYGLYLEFVELTERDDFNQPNQYPISNTMGIRYSYIEIRYEGNKPQLWVSDKWGENTMSHSRWKQNDQSNDIVKVELIKGSQKNE